MLDGQNFKDQNAFEKSITSAINRSSITVRSPDGYQLSVSVLASPPEAAPPDLQPFTIWSVFATWSFDLS